MSTMSTRTRQKQVQGRTLLLSIKMSHIWWTWQVHCFVEQRWICPEREKDCKTLLALSRPLTMLFTCAEEVEPDDMYGDLFTHEGAGEGLLPIQAAEVRVRTTHLPFSKPCRAVQICLPCCLS